MSFADFGLHPSLLKVLPEIGYKNPTPIQQEAIPLILTGRDLLGSAQTGTGKTAAFLLPVFHRLLSEAAEGTQVLVLEPTRELALQVDEQAKVYSRYTPLRSACIYGGVAFGPQEKALADGVEVIAATPGRLLDHLRQGHARFDKLRVLVLDEVDRMLDMGFLPDVKSILQRLPERRQTLFFSATVPDEIEQLADKMLKNPVKIAIAPNRKTAEGITQQVYPVPEHLKPALLEKLLNHAHVTSALVFTRTKQGADKVCAVVERRGLPVNRIHGDLSQAQRLKALEQFKNGEVKFLVATDIAARGLDVEGISHVINYDLPDSPDDYVHRIGRTARAGETGYAYSLFSPRDAAALSAIEKHLGQKIEKVIMPNFNYDEPLGVQHEVRQGHNVRDFEELGRPGAGPARPAPWKDEDERVSVTLLYSPDQDPAQAQAGVSTAGNEGGERGGRRRRRRGRGNRDGRSEREEQGERGGDREAPAKLSNGSTNPANGPGFGRQERGGRGESRNLHQTNVALTATDVLRKASDQKAVVGNDMLDLRPRSEGPDENLGQPTPAAAPAANDEGGPRKRRRRRRRRGRGGQTEAAAQNQNQGGGDKPHPGDPRPEARRNERGGRDRQGRSGQRNRDERRPVPSGAAKAGLLARLKGFFGLGSSGGGLADKW
jgi:ATP-dependent RNA helicase RhlE